MGWLNERDDDGELIEGCYIHAVTDKAVLVTPMDGREKVWIPKSMILDPDPDELEKWQSDVDLTVRTWFARKHLL